MAGATKQTMDFTNVKDGGGNFNKKRFPEGDYKARIAKVEDAVSKSKNKMWLYTIEVKYKGAVGTYPHYCVLTENSLWKLRTLFAACGIIIPKKKMAIDPNKIVGRVIGVTLEDSEYDSKLQSDIAATMPASEVTDDDVPDTDEDGDEDEDEDEETTEDEVEDEDEEEEEEKKPAPKRRTKAAAAKTPTVTKKKPREVEDDDLEELDLDEL